MPQVAELCQETCLKAWRAFNSFQREIRNNIVRWFKSRGPCFTASRIGRSGTHPGLRTAKFFTVLGYFAQQFPGCFPPLYYDSIRLSRYLALIHPPCVGDPSQCLAQSRNQ